AEIVLKRLGEQRPHILWAGDRHHGDEAEDQLDPACRRHRGGTTGGRRRNRHSLLLFWKELSADEARIRPWLFLCVAGHRHDPSAPETVSTGYTKGSAAQIFCAHKSAPVQCGCGSC